MYNNKKIELKILESHVLGSVIQREKLLNNSPVGENCPEVFHGGDVYKQSFCATLDTTVFFVDEFRDQRR